MTSYTALLDESGEGLLTEDGYIIICEPFLGYVLQTKSRTVWRNGDTPKANQKTLATQSNGVITTQLGEAITTQQTNSNGKQRTQWQDI